jgi:hypothetical protein
VGRVIRLPVDDEGRPRESRRVILSVIRELAAQVYGRDWGYPAYRYMGYYELLAEYDSLKDRMIDMALEAS